jgi:periplasmic protein TonB
VHGIEVLSGNPILAEAARAAVRHWRYRPTLLDGQPVEVETQITVNFVLQ